MRRSTRLQGRVAVSLDERNSEEVEPGTHNSKRKAPSPSPSPAPEEADEEYDEASHSKRKAGAKKNPKAAAQATKSTKPPSTDPSTWPESKIADDATITKGDAVKQYRLNAKTDFDGLKSQKVRTGSGYIALLYHTRDIERRAWEKHGGPEGFEHYLSKLKARHEKNTANKPEKKTFNEPHPNADKFDVIMKKYEQEMASLEKDFFPWLWKAIQTYLTSGRDECVYLGYDPYHDLKETKEWLQLIRVAKVQGLQNEYPLRPDDPAPDSDSFRALKELLDLAPGIDGFDWYNPPDGIWTHEDGFTGDPSHGWTKEFEDNVNGAMDAVVAEHGTDYKLHAQWMLYDTHVRCIGGLGYRPEEYYYRSKAFWYDEAARVFKGPLGAQQPL